MRSAVYYALIVSKFDLFRLSAFNSLLAHFEGGCLMSGLSAPRISKTAWKSARNVCNYIAIDVAPTRCDPRHCGQSAAPAFLEADDCVKTMEVRETI